mmetsp:Transcript_129128/g.373767  ORF Transcript_129128/g.373767 Transcript_129128/m.373767 type:complete len:465 (-) Transcript_129128:318-1712(-)
MGANNSFQRAGTWQHRPVARQTLYRASLDQGRNFGQLLVRLAEHEGALAEQPWRCLAEGVPTAHLQRGSFQVGNSGRRWQLHLHCLHTRHLYASDGHQALQIGDQQRQSHRGLRRFPPRLRLRASLCRSLVLGGHDVLVEDRRNQPDGIEQRRTSLLQGLRRAHSHQRVVDLHSHYGDGGHWVHSASSADYLRALLQKPAEDPLGLLLVILLEPCDLHSREAVYELAQHPQRLGTAPHGLTALDLFCELARPLPHLDEDPVELSPRRFVPVPVEFVVLSDFILFVVFRRASAPLASLWEHLPELLVRIPTIIRGKLGVVVFLSILALFLSLLVLLVFFVGILPVLSSLLLNLLVDLLRRGHDKQLLHLLEKLKSLGVASLVGMQLQGTLLERPFDGNLRGRPGRNAQERPSGALLQRLEPAVRMRPPILKRDDLVAKLFVAQSAKPSLDANSATGQLLGQAPRV